MTLRSASGRTRHVVVDKKATLRDALGQLMDGQGAPPLLEIMQPGPRTRLSESSVRDEEGEGCE